jgi:hypothetical protein
VSGVTIVATCEDPSAETLTEEGEPATFVVAQAHSPAVQLRLQYPVLFPQEFDEIVLLPFEPADRHGDDQVQRQHARRSAPNPCRGSFWTLRRKEKGKVPSPRQPRERKVAISLRKVARPAGLEPATSWFVARRSIQLS